MDSRKPPAPRSFRKMVNVTVAIDHRKGKVKTYLQSVLTGQWFGFSGPPMGAFLNGKQFAANHSE